MPRTATSAPPAPKTAPAPAPLRAWPADTVERWPLSKIKPYPRNARLHSDDQVEKIAASMLHFGVTVPVLVDEEGVLVYGHGRWLGAQLLVSRGHDAFAELPVCLARGWPEADKQAYRITDNQLALLSEWDLLALQAEGAQLQIAGFAMPLLGLDDGFFSGLPAARPAGNPEHAPEASPAPVVRPGDLWLLGPHRLLCGDATRKSDVDRLLKGLPPPRLMATDPPYGVSYDPAWRSDAGVGSKGAAKGKVKNDDRAGWSRAFQLFPGSVAYVWHGGLHAGTVERSLAESGYVVRAQIVWIKSRPVLSRGAYHWAHEPVYYAVKDGAEDDRWQRFTAEHELASYAVEDGEKGNWRGGRKQSTVWHIEHVKSETGHGTQKPIACMQRPIENNSQEGDGVYDPFVGSGTTIIAAEITNRRCYAIDLDPAYVQVALERWQAFTQKAGTLDGDGRSFDVIRAERSKPTKRR